MSDDVRLKERAEKLESWRNNEKLPDLLIIEMSPDLLVFFGSWELLCLLREVVGELLA